ncbi:MAG: pyridoxamine 5'-phosphate oxidase family protein [Acidobacteriota bacterium]
MGQVFTEIDDRLADFLRRQPVFFVATAPLAGDGLINLSPKGLAGTFEVLGPTTVAYLDLTGSGIEIVAHVRENRRIVLMFCAFEGEPLIVRLWGRGEVLEPSHPEFQGLMERFPEHPGARSIVRVECGRIQEACGYGVPVMEYAGERSELIDYAERQGEEGLSAYRARKNRRSLDGLPGLEDLPDESRG